MGRKGLAEIVAVGMLWLCAGCARQPAMPAASGEPTGQQHLSFAKGSEESRPSATAFLETKIPVGTLVTVRLRSDLSSAKAQAGDSFDAVLGEALTAKDAVIAPEGAVVTGRVVAAKASSEQYAGFLRLTLATVSIQGKVIPGKSSSVFLKGAAAKDIELSADRSLTFRLTDPITLHD